MIFNANTTAQEFIDDAVSRGACGEAVDWLNSVKTPGMTFLEIALIYEEADFMIANPSWGVWTFKVYYDDLPAQARIRFLRKIHSPMMAYKIYEGFESTLSNKEKKALQELFKGKLPNVPGAR